MAPLTIETHRIVRHTDELVDSSALLSTSALSSHRQQLLEKAKDNILKALERQKNDYDRRRANPKVYTVGSKVLKDFLRKKRKGGKMDAKYVGPHVITHLGTLFSEVSW